MYQTKLITMNKALALLLSLTLILTAVFCGTFAYIVTQTPSLLNTFLSGLEPTGDLIISKEVTHPFESSYVIPSGITFDFTVSLGEDYVGKTVDTSQGEKQADENGDITVTIAPDEAVRVQDIPEGTSVTITETQISGFTASDGSTKNITITRGDNHICYTNAYAPNPVDPVNLFVTGTKVLEGRQWQEGDSFTFLLEYKLAGTEDEWKEMGTASVTYELIEVQDPEFPDDPEKTIWVEKPDFNKFSFTELLQSTTYSTAGEYAFRVSEVDGTIGGITYDKVVSYFDVLVGDADMDGSLEIQDVTGYQNAVAEKDENGNFNVEVTVNNKYAPAGTAGVTIHINKSVLSRSGEDRSYAGYTFELYDESGSLVATSRETSAAGETSIELTFEAKDAGTTFHYTLKETHSGESHNGLTYDSTVYSISVSVVDDLDGTISAYIYNRLDYKTEFLTINPEGTEPTEGEEYPTEGTDTPTKGSEDPTEGTDTPTEGTDDPIENTDMPAEDPTDPSASNSSINNETDTPVEPVTTSEMKEVAVIPEGASNIDSVSFVNIYDPTDTRAFFDGSKELTGRGLNEGEFSFDLYATSDSFTVTEDMEPIQSVTNGADGSFTFTAIPYDKVGTYRYVVKENASAELGGVTYDDSVFHVIVTVTDENGVLTAGTVITDELGTASEIQFKNKYKAAATSVTFTGTKALTGMDLAADMFRFLLYSADENYTIQGASLAGASNDASGQFAFERITYSEPGTFYYVVEEDASAQVKGMTYDDTAYGIRVNVWDDGTGNLKAAVTISDVGGGEVDAILFENSYTGPVDPTNPSEPTDPSKPTDPSDPTDPPTPTDPPEPTDPPKPSTPVDPDVPPTGDDSPVWLYVVLLAISIVAIILLLVTGKRKKKSGRYLR